jgi:hypothetical protein
MLKSFTKMSNGYRPVTELYKKIASYSSHDKYFVGFSPQVCRTVQGVLEMWRCIPGSVLM